MAARAMVAAVILLVFCVCGACAILGGGAVAADPQGPPGTASPTPSPPGGTDLRIVVRDGTATMTWRLTCDPAGGSHPDAQRACRVLAEGGDRALPAVPADVACTEIWGGAQSATIQGVRDGRRVDSSLSRANGCEISRWDRLVGVLPRGGI